MENFVFSSRAKTVTGSLAVLGLLCLIATYFVDGGEGHHMRFWTNLLHNSVFFLGIGFIASFAYCAFTTAYAGWFVQFKRVWEGMSQWMLYGLILMGVIIVGLWTHSHHLYHWNDAAAVDADAILSHKSAFLNKYWYTFGTIGFVAVWIWFMGRITAISRDEDKNGTTDYTHHARIKKYAAPFLIIAGFTSAALIWQWIMSIDSHWYSTMFAWYASASLFVAMTAMTIMVLIYLKSRGYYDGITAEHFHDLGKYLFAISIFWTYVWFSQFMLIWYGNVGEETIYFRERMDNYPVLFWGNLLLNFILPFFILMRNDTKRKFGTLFFAAAIVFFGHWVDYFSMIKPGARLALIEMEAHHGGDHHGEEHAAMDAGHAADHATGEHGEDHATDHTAADHGDDHAAGDHAEESGLEPTVGGYTDATLDDADLSGDADVGYGRENEQELAYDDAPGTEVADGYPDEAPHGALEFKSGYTLPGLLEIGTFLGFLGGFLFLLLNSLTKAPLEPKRDPYMEESLHHHT